MEVRTDVFERSADRRPNDRDNHLPAGTAAITGSDGKGGESQERVKCKLLTRPVAARVTNQWAGTKAFATWQGEIHAIQRRTKSHRWPAREARDHSSTRRRVDSSRANDF